MFVWLDKTEPLAKADAIVDKYCRRRATIVAMGIPREKQDRRYDGLRQDAIVHSRGFGPNFYKRTHFLQRLRAGLRAKGIPDQEADGFMRAVLTAPLARRP